MNRIDVRRCGLGLFLTLLTLTVWATPGGADDQSDLDAAFDRGEKLASEGKYAEAARSYEQALALARKVFGEEHPNTAGIMGHLASVYQAMGQYARAEPLYQRALEIYEARLGKDHPDTATSLNNLAGLYQAMGQYARAEPLYQRALEIREARLGKDHPDTATSLNNLAGLYQAMGQYARAEPLFKRALEICEARLGKDHPATAASLNNLALLYQAMGQYAKAELLFKRALEIREARLGKDHPDTANSLHSLASLYAAMADWERSADYLDRARRSRQVYVGLTLPVLSDAEQDQFLSTQDEESFHLGLSLGVGRRDHPRTRTLSAGWVLNGKAVAAQARAQRVLLARDATSPPGRRMARQLADTRQSLAATTLRPAPPGQEAARRQRIAELTLRADQLSRQLTALTGRDAKPTTWTEPADVRAALPADGVLIEIARFHQWKFDRKPGDQFWLGERYAAWVIPPTGSIQVIDLGPAGPIDEAVKALRQELGNADPVIKARGEPGAEKAVRQPLGALSKLVLHPLLPHLGDAKSWVLSPDSQLWLAPWAALTMPDGTYAVEGHTLRYVVTGRDLLARKNDRVKPTAPLVMADPDFDLGSKDAAAETRKLTPARPDDTRALSKDFKLGGVPRLAGTAIEAEAIAPKLEAAFGKPRVLTDRQALAGVFKAAKNPRVVVLSTHGFFLEDPVVECKNDGRGGFLDDRRPSGPVSENPLLRCGLLFAGCNHHAEAGPNGENGVLTGLEIVGTDLRGTELVVLSACETGLGEVKTGEGVAGLRQAFELAGAESVAATLWQVPDRESAVLMVGFFDRLARGEARDTALRGAQVESIERHRKRFGASHPYFWAAYTLTGQAK